MGLFGSQVPLGVRTQRGVAREAQHPLVDAHGAGLAGVVGAQVGHHRRRQRVAWRPGEARRHDT